MVSNNLLKEKLNEAHLSPLQLAKLIGVTENCIFQYIMGRRTPRWQRAHDIALVLKVPAEQLFNLHKFRIQKCKTCDMPKENRDKNSTIKNNTGLCSFCYLARVN